MTKIFHFTGHNTNSSSVHFIIQRTTPVQIPNFMIPFSAEQFVQQAVNFARTKYWHILNAPGVRENGCFLDVPERFLQKKCDLWLEEANLNVPETNGELNFEAFSFLLNIIAEEKPIFFEDNDNVYAYRKIGISDNDFHRLSALIDYMRHDTVFVKKIDNNSFVFYVMGNKWIIQKHNNPIYKPIMADIKITNKCKRGCAYCYQRSTPNGEHCDFNTLKKFIRQNPQIVEVAIGGGEPTEHPQFEEIVRWLQNKGIIVNFTTRNKDYLLSIDQNNRAFFDEEGELNPLFGAVGFSVNHPQEIFDNREFFNSLNVPVSIHLILWPSTIEWLLQNEKKLFDIFFSQSFDWGIDKECVIQNISQIVFLSPKVTHPDIAEFLRNDAREILVKKDNFCISNDTDNALLNEEIVRYYRMVMDKVFDTFTTKDSSFTRFAFDTPCLEYFNQKVLDENGSYTFEEATKYVEGALACYFDAVENRVYNNSYEKVPMKIRKK